MSILEIGYVKGSTKDRGKGGNNERLVDERIRHDLSSILD